MNEHEFRPQRYPEDPRRFNARRSWPGVWFAWALAVAGVALFSWWVGRVG